ncbi:hypothetical protein KC349_g9431 [Hortaea werneckii]|nr:hypothetical protein KC349_g9431 [Hortaea werneckii]
MPLVLAIQQHHETVSLDIVDMASHDIVMGTPWLEKHNPLIDWRKRVLKFERCGCVTNIQPMHRQRAMIDEERQFCELERQPITYSDRNGKEMVSTDTEPAQPGRKVRDERRTNAPPEIPEEFKKWKPLFQEEEGLAALPRHQPWDHRIQLQPGKDPPWGPLYRLSEKELEEQRRWLKEKSDKGWIEKSQSPAASPAMFVPKKGGKLRMVIDYRRLNEVTVKNRYPLPNIEEMQDRLTGANWYSKIDLRDAFYAVRMAKGEEWKTAFRTRYGLYQFRVMPMGLTNAPATCQQLVNDVLRDLLDITAIAYVDDILIFTRGSREQHTKDVQAVLERLSTVDFKTAPEKCEFYKKEIEFLGFIISTTGIKMDPKKIQSIEEWPTPKTVTEIQAFLGLANYNRKFVEGYSRLAIPLTSLTKKDTEFVWTEKQEKAF